MPSRKEIQWSQLRVGALVVVAAAIVLGLIFLMSSTTGGIFAKKIALRAFFANASGLKKGAPVTLEGVTIGNVTGIVVDPSHNPNPVEVNMTVGVNFRSGLHTDSTATITQAGVLGDSYVDIDSTQATGPPPPLKGITVLPASGAPTVQDVVRTSEESIQKIQALTDKLNTLIGNMNTRKGLIGELINDPALAKKFVSIATNLDTVTTAIAGGKGTLGKLATDDTLYRRMLDATDKLDQIATALNAGQGTLGQLVQNRELYDHASQALDQAQQLLQAFRANPKKYLQIHMKVF